MIRIFIIIFLSSVSFAFSQDNIIGDKNSLTLKEAYALALKRSESIEISSQVLKEADGRSSQALSTILPQLAWESTHQWQDRSADNSTRHYTPNGRLYFSQPLFSGFKEFAAISAGKAEHKQRQAELERAKQLLFIDVSDAFYFLKNYQESHAVLEETNNILVKHQGELKRRQSLGRSRTSELASVESRYFQNQALIVNLKAQEEIARQLIEYLVGGKVDKLLEEDVLAKDLGQKEAYILRVDVRPDIRAALEASKAAHKKVIVARSGYWPTVDVSGNSYTKRVGSLADVDWGLSLNINVPIFSGGMTKGKVIEMEALARESDLKYEQAKRLAQLDIDNAWIKLISQKERLEAYGKAVAAAQNNYDLQFVDYGNNLINNLDVLKALEDLQAIKSDYVSVKSEAARAYWAFKVAIGDIANDAL